MTPETSDGRIRPVETLPTLQQWQVHTQPLRTNGISPEMQALDQALREFEQNSDARSYMQAQQSYRQAAMTLQGRDQTPPTASTSQSMSYPMTPSYPGAAVHPPGPLFTPAVDAPPPPFPPGMPQLPFQMQTGIPGPSRVAIAPPPGSPSPFAFNASPPDSPSPFAYNMPMPNPPAMTPQSQAYQQLAESREQMAMSYTGAFGAMTAVLNAHNALTDTLPQMPHQLVALGRDLDEGLASFANNFEPLFGPRSPSDDSVHSTRSESPWRADSAPPLVRSHAPPTRSLSEPPPNREGNDQSKNRDSSTGRPRYGR